MEKDNLFMNGCSPTLVDSQLLCSSGMEGQMGEPNCSSEQLPTCYLNLNWENSMDQSAPFDSALSSIVSSPAGSNAAGPTESVIIRELIGRLGSICNSGEISPQSQTLGRSAASYIGGNSSTNTSCYSTPLNSPPKLNLSMMDHQLRGNLPLPGTSLPAHPTLAPLPADPGFAERAARFSCFGSRNFNGLMNPVGFNEAEFAYRSAPRMENGKLSRVSSSQSLKAAGSQMVGIENKDVQLQDGLENASVSAFDRKFRQFSRSSTPENAEFSIAHEDSSASEKILVGEASSKGASDANSRKRKGVPRGKVKDLPSSPSKDAKVAAEDEDSNAKRCKPAETTSNEKESTKAKAEPNSSTNTAGDGNQKPPEPPKDYIHVRARRGQATDSHSLAERVRREKISERMKLLQDLVPGCNKVTGKAVMLDEIINYVQSLQRQVEFLSMKLATVNPRLDFNMETLLSKDVLQPRGSLQHGIYPLDSSSSAFPYGQQPQQGPPVQSSISNGIETQFSLNPLDAALSRNVSMQLPPLDGLGEASSQLATFWEDDLQSVVQMGFGQNQSQEPLFQSQRFHGSSPPAHMKLEL